MAVNPYIQVNPVAWRTIANKVYQLTRETLTDPATYRVTVKAIDSNDFGESAIENGYYFKDYLGHTYTVIAYTSTTVDIEDSFRIGFAPTPNKHAIIYKSIEENSPYLAPIFYRFLSNQAEEYSRQIELAVLWNNAGGGATDEKVKYDAADPTAGYLADKIIAGTNITIEEGTGADENKLVISSTGGGATTYLGLTDTSDTTYTGKDLYLPMVDEANSELDLTPSVLATLLKLDGPTTYTGAGGFTVRIKQDLSGFEFLPDGMNEIIPTSSLTIYDNYSKILAAELELSASVDLTIEGTGTLTII